MYQTISEFQQLASQYYTWIGRPVNELAQKYNKNKPAIERESNEKTQAKIAEISLIRGSIDSELHIRFYMIEGQSKLNKASKCQLPQFLSQSSARLFYY